jgi:AcrR family transcriptional regulator
MSKKDDILNTALELFIKNGIENTPTSLISKEAGVATGTLFHHFKTKEDLIKALYIHLKQDFLNSMHVDIQSTSSIKDKIELIWFEFTKWGIANAEKFQFLQMAGTSKYIEESTREQVEALFEDVKKVITAGYERKVFQIQPHELFHKILDAHLYATLTYFIENPEQFKNKDVVRYAFGSFWRALTST